MSLFDDIGSAVSGAVSGLEHAASDAVSGLEKGAGQALQVGEKLLSNPMVDTAITSMLGMPEAGPILSSLIGGLDSQGGGAPLNLLGQLPGLFGGASSFLGAAGGMNGLAGNPMQLLQGLLGGAGAGAGAGAGGAGGLNILQILQGLTGNAQTIGQGGTGNSSFSSAAGAVTQAGASGDPNSILNAMKQLDQQAEAFQLQESLEQVRHSEDMSVLKNMGQAFS